MTCLPRSKKAQHNTFEQFKFRHAEKAYCFFGRPAIELTDGEWLFLIGMVTAVNTGPNTASTSCDNSGTRIHSVRKYKSNGSDKIGTKS